MYDRSRIAGRCSANLTRGTTTLLALKTKFRLSLLNLVWFTTRSTELKTIGAIRCMPRPDSVIRLSQSLTTTQLWELHESLLVCSNNLHLLQDSLRCNLDWDQHKDSTFCTYLDCLELLKAETEKLSRLLDSLKSAAHKQDDLTAHSSISPSITIQGRISQHRQSDQTREKLNNYRSVRSLSTSLYHALEDACQDHPQHLAHIQLQQHRPAPAEKGTCVEFKMRFVGSNETPSAAVRSHEAVWLSVQSSIRKHDKSAVATHT